jgi:hypothetical protein
VNARILAAALLGLGARSAAPEGVSLTPAVVQLAGGAGESTTQRLTLRNDTGVPLAFSLEARDVVVRHGRREMLAPGEIPASVAATAVFSDPAVIVQPHASRSVVVTLTIPPGVEHRAVVALFRGTTRLGDAGAGSTVSLGTLLTFTLSDHVSVRASELRVIPQSAAVNTAFEETLANDGHEPLVPKGVAVVLDAAGMLVARAAFEPRRLLPGEEVVFRTEFPGELRSGRYRALATFEFEGKAVTRAAELAIP